MKDDKLTTNKKYNANFAPEEAKNAFFLPLKEFSEAPGAISSGVIPWGSLPDHPIEIYFLNKIEYAGIKVHDGKNQSTNWIIHAVKASDNQLIQILVSGIIANYFTHNLNKKDINLSINFQKLPKGLTSSNNPVNRGKIIFIDRNNRSVVSKSIVFSDTS